MSTRWPCRGDGFRRAGAGEGISRRTGGSGTGAGRAVVARSSAAVVLVGVVRAFNAPVSRALLPQLVPEEHFPNAVAWNASIFQAATILGPSIGGFLYALSRGPTVVYATAVVTSLAAVFSTLRITLQTQARPREPVNWNTVLAGFHYIWSHKLVLGSISLDMFAVLLGGAVALLPVYASEILKTGPWGLGLLRSAPGIGASAMAILVAHRPLRRHAGLTMLWCVAGFGVCTIIFGLSRSLALSLVGIVLARRLGHDQRDHPLHPGSAGDAR